MIIILLIAAAIVISAHKALMKTVEDYNYGSGGSFREWQEFERQYGYNKN